MTHPDYRALCAELLAALENAIRVIYHEDGTNHISTADAVIAKADAALAQPEPVGPTDEELMTAYWQGAGLAGAGTGDHILRGIRSVLTRYSRPTTTPIPVSERLPGAEDCDAEGRLYAVYNGRWFQIDLSCIVEGGFTHWLPFHALPLPGQPAPAAPEP
jgi:hypothetical protein